MKYILIFLAVFAAVFAFRVLEALVRYYLPDE